MPLDPTLAAVPPGLERGGQIFGIEVRGTQVFAVGGAHHGPVLLHSHDAGISFEACLAPEVPGLRGIYVDDGDIWLVGETGIVARATGLGKPWNRVAIGERSDWSRGTSDLCLYAIVRDPRGRYWITGDDGLVLRSSATSVTFERIPTKTKGRVLKVFIDPKLRRPWIVDTAGRLQYLDGKRFRAIQLSGVARPALNHMTRTPADSLVIAGNEGTVLRSSDDGKTWERSATPTNADLAWVTVTRYGMLVCGHDATLLISHDDGQTFAAVDTTMTGKLWTIANLDGAVLIGGDGGAIYRFAAKDLAELLYAALAGRDDRIASLALRVQECDDGAELVLTDALRERGMW